MRLNRFFPILAIVSALPAWGAESTTISLGVRAWVNEWTSWDVYPPVAISGGSLPGASESFTSDSRVAAIPTLTVRHNDMLFSASQFIRQSYGFDGNGGVFSAKRQETDMLAGYYVLPTLAITAGYKEVKQDFGGSAQFKYSGPVVGIVASAPLTSGFSLYGAAGLGRMNARLPLNDADGRNRLKANYLLGEVGLAYSLDTRSLMPAAKALTLTAGYRSQVLAVQGFRIPLGTNANSGMRSTDLRDTTEGFTLGASVSF